MGRKNNAKNKDMKILNAQEWFEKYCKIDPIDFIEDHATAELMQEYAIYVRDYVVDFIGANSRQATSSCNWFDCNFNKDSILNLKNHQDLKI